MGAFKKMVLPWLGEALGPWFIDGLCSSLRLEVRGGEHLAELRDRAHILAFWHARGMVLGYFFRHCDYLVMVSENTDGEILARALAPMGIGTIRGSTSRGASQALLAAARMLKSGRPVAVTPDGPRGPRHVFQAGALAAARLGGVPVLPVTASVDRAFVFPSWDRFILPRSESRAVIHFLPPVSPPAKDDLEPCRLKLERDLSLATDLLDAELGLEFPAVSGSR